jgi:glycosyltransferase involved in cell wall biosynthesis
MKSREFEESLPMPKPALAGGQLPLSVIIITMNEAENLAPCLASLAGIAAEVVVVDSGSQDGTIEIARAAGARVILNSSWPGFGPQKNIALQAASCDWVLSLDADERLTDTLRDQIRAAVGEAGFDSYEMPRLSRYGCARFPDDLVHERVGALQKVKLDGSIHLCSTYYWFGNRSLS